MSKKFYAVNRRTGERWKPDPSVDGRQFLMLYDSGYAASVLENFYTYVTPLNPNEWEVVIKESILRRGDSFDE